MLTADLTDLVATELANLGDADSARVKKYLVKPRCELRPWGYVPEEHACWIVLEHPGSDTGIAYCETGFGPNCPWGLLWLTEDEHLGQDSSWYPTLWDAYQGSWAYEESS